MITKSSPTTRSRKKPLPSRLNSRMRRRIEREKHFGSRVSVGRQGTPAVNFNLSFDTLPFRLDGVAIKRSERWYNGPKIISTYHIPHIDSWGAFTGCTYASVRCSPQQFVATVVSTLLSRFRLRALRYNRYSVVVANSKLLAKAAYYYAVSKNNWFHGRLCSLLKNLEKGKKAIRGLLNRFMLKMDDYTRFVYSQVNFQTHWLFSRAGWPRDKSIFFRNSKYFSSCEELHSEFQQYKAIRLISVRISHLCPARFETTARKRR